MCCSFAGEVVCDEGREALFVARFNVTLTGNRLRHCLIKSGFALGAQCSRAVRSVMLRRQGHREIEKTRFLLTQKNKLMFRGGKKKSQNASENHDLIFQE